MATYNNTASTTLTNGVVVTVPIIAVNAFCVMTFASTSQHAGEVRTITCGGKSVTVTLDNNGGASLSLLPFMRNDIAFRNVLDLPLVGTGGSKWRYVLTITVSKPSLSEVDATLSVYYIFGDFPPKGTAPTDVWLTYNTATGDYNIVGVEWADHYTNGVPNSVAAFQACLNDPATWQNPPSATNPNLTFAVLKVCSDKLYSENLNYHFVMDCRTENVVQLRWLDQNGYENTRKLSRGTEQRGASSANIYQRPHDTRIISNGYYYGRDQWSNRETVRTLNVGDECIPIEQYEWLCSLAASQCVEIREGGVWVRCNIADASVERNYQKNTFTISLALVMPCEENINV